MNQYHKITYDFIENIPVIYIEGDMTSDADKSVMGNYSEIRSKTETESLIVNFENTNYINSAGIATLINIIQDIGENKANISFVGLTPHFEKVMTIVGITDFVKIFKTNEEAIKYYQS